MPSSLACSFPCRSVKCPSVLYEPVKWRERFTWFLRNLHTLYPKMWARFADRPILELIEHLKTRKDTIPLARLVLGWGFINKSEVFARAVLVIAQREKGLRPWVLTTLRTFVVRPGWLDDLVDVYIVYAHDTLLVYGPR
jgi:hypothetical protein